MLRLGALAALVLLVACDTGRDEATLVVDLFGGWYDDTQVRVEVNDEVVFEGRATTGPVLATAGIFDVSVLEGEHHVRAIVEGAVGEIAVHTDTTVTVAVSYDPEAGTVSFGALPFRIPHR